MAADPEHGDEVLLEMLSEQQYERFVAEDACSESQEKRRTTDAREQVGRTFGKVWAAREGKETEEFVEERRSRYADAIRALVEKILAEREAATG